MWVRRVVAHLDETSSVARIWFRVPGSNFPGPPYILSLVYQTCLGRINADLSWPIHWRATEGHWMGQIRTQTASTTSRKCRIQADPSERLTNAELLHFAIIFFRGHTPREQGSRFAHNEYLFFSRVRYSSRFSLTSPRIRESLHGNLQTTGHQNLFYTCHIRTDFVF